MKIIMNLTEDEAEKLYEVLASYWDEGPHNEGWQSPELEVLSHKAAKAIKVAKDS